MVKKQKKYVHFILIKLFFMVYTTLFFSVKYLYVKIIYYVFAVSVINVFADGALLSIKLKIIALLQVFQ